ncbi:MAG: hypothetical protein GY911_05925, partial [Actinomycetales bacterium]|nr:hypothetical protein [Actinomycetales bacterium]
MAIEPRRTTIRIAFATSLLAAALLSTTTAAQTPIPGQAGGSAAPPADRPMARSKYAPDPSTLPELRMIGTLAPSP